jgi:hypothetical protein
MGWFDNIKSSEELFAEYKKLTKLHHPDLFQNESEDIIESQTEIITEINQEFEQKKKEFLNKSSEEFEKTYSIKNTWKSFTENLTPEAKGLGEKFVNSGVDFLSKIIKEKANKKLWK